MTKKLATEHFVLIARVLKAARPTEDIDPGIAAVMNCSIDHASERMANALEVGSGNQYFYRRPFLKACGVKTEYALGKGEES